MSTTPSPCSPRRRTSASTCSVCATPSAAVGSSRITSFEFHCTAFATATDWRWPPESVATGWRIDLIVVTASDFSVSAVCCSIGASFRICEPVAPRGRGTCSGRRRGCRRARDPGRRPRSRAARVLRPVDVHLLALEEDLAAVGGVRAGDALDSVDLPAPLSPTSAITSPCVHLEVDVGQRLHRAERLRDVRGAGGVVCRSSCCSCRGERGGGARRAPPPSRVTRSYLQYCLYAPTQTSLFFRNLSVKSARVVRLRDPDDRKRQRRLLLLAVLPEAVRLRLLAVEERDRSRSRGVRLVRHVLVDRARLPAGEDVLDALRRDASWPLSGIGFRCLAFRSAMTAPAMLSFAAMTPLILLFVLTSIC